MIFDTNCSVEEQQQEAYESMRRERIDADIANWINALDIGSNLKKYRKSLKITQPSMAKIMGVSLASYCEYEKSRRLPSILSLARIVVGELAEHEHYGSGDCVTLDELVLSRKNEPVKNVTKSALEVQQDLYQYICKFHNSALSNSILRTAFLKFVDLKELVTRYSKEIIRDRRGAVSQMEMSIDDKLYEFTQAGPKYDPEWETFSPEEYDKNPEECKKLENEVQLQRIEAWESALKQKGLDPLEIRILLE